MACGFRNIKISERAEMEDNDNQVSVGDLLDHAPHFRVRDCRTEAGVNKLLVRITFCNWGTIRVRENCLEHILFDTFNVPGLSEIVRVLYQRGFLFDTFQYSSL